jgi:hypothetical protein
VGSAAGGTAVAVAVGAAGWAAFVSTSMPAAAGGSPVAGSATAVLIVQGMQSGSR